MALAIARIVLVTISVIAALSGIRIPGAFELVLYGTSGILAIILLIYMISVLAFFKERKAVIAAFIIYTAVDVVVRLDGILEGTLHFFMHTTFVIISTIAFFATIMLFISGFFIRSKIAFAPCVLFTSTLGAIAMLKVLVTMILPLFSDAVNVEPGWGFYGIRQVINYVGALSVLLPAAVLMLAYRVNKYLYLQQIES